MGRVYLLLRCLCLPMVANPPKTPTCPREMARHAREGIFFDPGTLLAGSIVPTPLSQRAG